MTKYALNQDHNGIELYFSEKPNSDVMNALKANGWRWHNVKKCWYNRQTAETMKQADAITAGQQIEQEAKQEEKPEQPERNSSRQAELKKLYEEILKRDVWKKDQHMVDYCVKKSAYIVELENGDIITIEKPSIEKDFCFGYSDSRYDTEDYDRANDAAHHAATNEEYFISQNLKELNKMIAHLDGTEPSRYDFYPCISYYNQPENSALKSLHCYDPFDAEAKNLKPLAGADRERVLEGYKIVKVDFEKRLQTYLKRYGLSKINTWSYWRDA